VFENRVMRGICVFAPKRDEVTAGWRKLENKEFKGVLDQLLGRY
jgi:hypothetical protein